MLMRPPSLPADYVKAPSYAELVQALEMIRHATAPTHDDGAYHEAAHELADDVLKRVEARQQWEDKNGAPPSYVTRPTPVGAGDGAAYTRSAPSRESLTTLVGRLSEAAYWQLTEGPGDDATHQVMQEAYAEIVRLREAVATGRATNLDSRGKLRHGAITEKPDAAELERLQRSLDTGGFA